jgi:hypothetical protein
LGEELGCHHDREESKKYAEHLHAKVPTFEKKIQNTVIAPQGTAAAV